MTSPSTADVTELLQKVQRYGNFLLANGGDAMAPTPDGEWVRYADLSVHLRRSPLASDLTEQAVEAAIEAAENAHAMGATVTRPMMRAALSAALPFFPSPSEEARPVAWPEEPDPYGEREQWGMTFALQQFAAGLGVEKWEGGDGSESVEGDVWVEFVNIAKAGGFLTPDGDTFLSMGTDALRVALATPGDPPMPVGEEVES